MAHAQDEVDHKAIWDDSVLVDSWNEALDEYKKYHSIRAKGGGLDDFERENPPAQDGEATEQDDISGNMTVLWQSIKEEEEEEGEVMPIEDEHAKTASATGENDLQPPGDMGAHQVSATLPTQAILGSVQDANLKRLLMAWYYAGYYMGLYEGQQQAQQPPP
ncbi:hypothetical protein CDD83_1289 [Cordyceps sp. RAO-2017]|nr:hypothetical protein CDD83_1289 [Cordyceps sp. RAO-2017]